MKNLTKPLFTVLMWVIGILGGLYAGRLLIIPTDPADHDAYLSTLVLGGEEASQTITVEPEQQDRLIIPERLVAGDVDSNIIGTGAEFAIIAGGSKNTIGGKADNSAIGAGAENEIYAENAIIGGWFDNTVGEEATGSVIGGGEYNTVSSQNITLGGGSRNTIWTGAGNSTIPGGLGLTISAPNSFAAGQAVNIGQTWTFAWSDYDDDAYWWSNLSPDKPNTFLVRSLNGMAINTGVSITWVNVIVEGGVQIGGSSGDDLPKCGTGNAGTFDMKQGCFYYCDGLYRQSLNAAFYAAIDEDEQTKCGHISRCEFDGIRLRPGDKVTAYSKQRAANCEDAAVKQTITCTDKEGWTFDKSGFNYSYCMPRDETSLDIIEKYHPR